MAKYTKKEQREQKIVSTAAEAGLEKFRLYAQPRSILMQESSYGIRTVVHHSNRTQREAVDAVAPTGEKGWIVNLNGRRRKFVTQNDNYIVL